MVPCLWGQDHPSEQLALEPPTDVAYAAHASNAAAAVKVLSGEQSKNRRPRPLLCAVWQLEPQHDGVAHSQPSRFAPAMTALQSDAPTLQV
jgi:hypothetical protein